MVNIGRGRRPGVPGAILEPVTRHPDTGAGSWAERREEVGSSSVRDLRGRVRKGAGAGDVAGPVEVRAGVTGEGPGTNRGFASPRVGVAGRHFSPQRP